MQIEVRIKENGKWRGPGEDEFKGTLDYRVAYLSKLETVIRIQTDLQEIILATGEWVEYYRNQNKVALSLVELTELLNVHPTIDRALKVLGGEVLRQETLFDGDHNGTV